ncbi:MAG: hypothetical protein ACJAYE_003344 [Candidatus Azotimanducaceae bacterium]|jgi:hypothetical protein
MRHIILISLLLLLGGCGTTVAVTGMYLKQNYLQVIQ